MKLSAIVIFLQIFFTASVAAAQPPVTLATGEMFVIDNGLVRMGIAPGGRLNELSYRGGPNLASSGYWNINGNGYDAEGKMLPQKFHAPVGIGKVLRQSDDLVEVVFVRQPAAPLFFQTSLHYVLRRGDPGFYLYMTAAHDEKMPPGYIIQYCYNLRLAPEHFDYIAVDDTRRNISHSCLDEKNAEMIMDATFRLADGTVVSKYNYSHAIEDGDFNLYGWAGPKTGVWWIQPSGEYYSSAPYRVLLTSHQTAKTPVIIWQTQCTHRGGYNIEFPPGDTANWEKIYGPVFVYLNSAKDYDAMWNDAKERVETIKTQWPHKWMSHKLFPLHRGQVSGKLNFDDNTPAANAFVILTPKGTHWSKENRGYHFWSKTDADGRFNVTNIRPGEYTLYASGADQFYEFSQDGITVAADKKLELGKLKWKRVSHGKRIWQIGTADRSSGEFANGDDFHHWGLWRRYPTDFPNDVHFEIGKSKERNDFNFAHWNWYSKKNAWDISFKLNDAPKGTATLTFGIAAARGHSSRGYGSRGSADLRVWVNDKETEGFTVAATGGDSYRSARQSTRYQAKEITFNADLLSAGKNTILLRHALSNPYKQGEPKGESGAGPGCIMYDAIRLEIE